jgi:hypothetical protein
MRQLVILTIDGRLKCSDQQVRAKNVCHIQDLPNNA